MLVFGTQIHLITFIFIVLELFMFSFQLAIFVTRPKDSDRKWYLILLFLLIFYNITGGLFPDQNIGIPLYIQNIIAYGSGFLMASYFPYYFYRAFELDTLRFHALYGVPLFLLLPYVIFFVIVYSVNRNLDVAVEYGIAAPFFYSIVVLRAICIAIYSSYKKSRDRNSFFEKIIVYCAVFPWASMTLLAFFKVDQPIEVLVTNSGFIIVTVIFIRKSIFKARRDYFQSVNIAPVFQTPEVFEKNMKNYQFTNREKEIVLLLYQGLRYKDIANQLHISERTVTTHVQNIYLKVSVSSKIALIRKLEK